MIQVSPDAFRQRIAYAEGKLPELETAYATAAFNHMADQGDLATVQAAEQTVNAAKAEIASLKAALWVAERLEAENLAKVRAELRAELVKKIKNEIRELTNVALRFEIAAENMASNFAKLTLAGEAVRNLLPPELRTPALGFDGGFSKEKLRHIAGNHLAKLAAPGVPQSMFSLHDAPTLSAEVKSWCGELMRVLDPPEDDAV